jgi:hypothetical protein
VVKRPGREADHSPLSSTDVKNASSYTSTPQYAFMARCSVKITYYYLPGAVSVVLKRPGHEVDHSHPSSTEVKNLWSYTSTPKIHLHDVVLS